MRLSCLSDGAADDSIRRSLIASVALVQGGDRRGRGDREEREEILCALHQARRARGVFADIFGVDFAKRVEAVQVEITTWKTIPWLKPAREITQDDLAPLQAAWWDALQPYRRLGCVEFPRIGRIVRERKLAERYTTDVTDAAAANNADAADAAVDADAADASAAIVDADAAADAAASAYRGLWPYWGRWYVRPRYMLWRKTRWDMLMNGAPNPFAPIVEMFKLGVAPLGYCRDPDGEVAFTVYVPPVGGV